LANDLFEAVFYGEPVPSSLKSLTLMALVFDKIHFPGVYIPLEGVDEARTLAEIERIRSLPRRREVENAQLLNCMVYAVHGRYLRDFCVFTGKPGYPGILEPGAEELTKEFEEVIFGPPPEGFFPSYSLGFAKGLPGDEQAAVNGPSWLSYPPNALLYASRAGLVLVNDNPELPVPSIGSGTYRSNARALASVLALESVRLVLPNLSPMSFEEIAELHAETSGLVAGFRSAMLRLSRELNDAIGSDAALADVQSEARFLAETMVLPELEEVRAQMLSPGKPWHRRIVDVAKDAPELVGNYAAMPAAMATAKVLAALANVFADVRDEQLEREGIEKRGAYHYLLKLEDYGVR
jgi:hypothetical protein